MDAVSTHQVNGVDALKVGAFSPATEAERVVWSHAFWARLNHENEKFTPSVAKACADEVLRHAREADVVEIMAAELKASAK